MAGVPARPLLLHLPRHVGLSLGLGLIIIWVGIPILLVVAGAWWLFGAFERVQAQYLLGADVALPPRSWETVNGVWAKLKAHFGNGATWKDLVYLFAKLPLGIVSFTLLVTVAGARVAGASPADRLARQLRSGHDGNGRLEPPLWLGILGVPARHPRCSSLACTC